MVTYAVSPSRVLLTVVQPPRTPCPLCVTKRIRANFGWQEIADLPLGTLLGTTEDTRWPGITAGASLVADAALRAQQISNDGARAVIRELQTATLAVTDHPLLRTPFCDACETHHAAAKAAMNRQDVGDGVSQLEHAWTSMQRAVDPITGIVASVEAVTRDDTAGSMTHAITVGRISTKWFSPVSAPALGGAAKIHPLHARVSALGEALERYACGIYHPTQLIRASLRELGPTAIDPRALPLGSEREYEKVAGRLFPYHRDKVIDWVKGQSLLSGDIRYVPACSVYVPYQFPRRDEVLLRPISTGLGAGTSDAQSIRAGLLEIIERDALSVTWYNYLRVPTLLLDTLPEGPAATIYRGLKEAGVELLCKLTTTDVGVPSVLLSSRQRLAGGQLIVAHAARADLDLVGAIQGGLEELAQSREAIREWIGARGIPPLKGPLKEMEDFFSYYCEDERLPMLDFLREGTDQPVVPTEGAPERHQGAVDEIVRRLANRGHESIAVDITPIDVAECGIKVNRVIVPGMQPISFSLDFRYLGGRRVFDAPVAMGLREHPCDESELNPDPLPAG
jgi:ribosomal protein S12 methylthiotransferase accessory factor